MKDITIVIAGKPSTGKSSIARVIAEVLNQCGIGVRMFDQMNDTDEKVENPQEGKSPQINATIRTVTTTRNLELIQQ